jgi:hypothetical protein
MTDLDTLIRRIDQELVAEVTREKTAWADRMQAIRHRQERIRRYEPVANHLIDLLRPRLAAFIERFKAVVKVEPGVRENTRSMNMTFAATVAKVTLTFDLLPDWDVSHIRLECTREIIPVLVPYDRQSALELHLDAVQDDAVVGWFDERVVAFVQAYIAVVRQDEDLKDRLVEGPWRRSASRSTSPPPPWSATAGLTTSWTRTPAGSSRTNRRRSNKGVRHPWTRFARSSFRPIFPRTPTRRSAWPTRWPGRLGPK